MKKILLWCLSLLTMICLSVAVGCKNNGNVDKNSSADFNTYAVSLNVYTLEMDLYGGEKQLKATTFKNNVITGESVVWESLNTDIVLVENGKLIPVSVGETVIVAFYEDSKAECKVSVISETVPVLKVEQPMLRFLYNVSSAYELDAYVLFLGEEYREEAEIRYSIPASGQSIATVNENGVVTPIGLGETELTVSAIFRNYDGIGMSITIPVCVAHDLEVSTVLNDGESDKIYQQKVIYDNVVYTNQTSFSYKVKEMQENGLVEVSDATVEWKTSDEAIATISDEGVVTAVNAGTVEVWCEYAYDGKMNASNKTMLEIYPYAVVKEEEKQLLFDKSNPSKTPTSNELFGEDYMGEITGIYLDGVNILDGDSVAISGYGDGKYTFNVANEDGYAFSYNGTIASITATVEDVCFGIMVGEKLSNVRYYNLNLPAKDEIRNLMAKGYKAIKFDYNYETTNVSEKVVVAAKYASELQQTLSVNEPGEFFLCLSDIYDRYEDLDEFVRAEYVFNVPEGSGGLILNTCSVTTKEPQSYVDFRIDRYTSMKDFTITNNIEIEGVVAQIAAQSTIKENGTAILQSSNAVSKEVTEQWLDDGYNVYRVKYYLAYDTSKQTKPLTASIVELATSSVIGEHVTLVANQWAEMTFRLDRWYAMRNNSTLFAMDVATADDGSAIDYALYIAFVKAEKVENINALDDIRMYAGYPVEMWTPTGEFRGVNEYDKQIGDKTAKFYTKFEQTKYAWGCYINFFTALNVTPEQLKTLQEEGYKTLDFDIYAKTSTGSNIRLVMNPEKKDVYSELHKYTLTDGEWTTVSIELDLLIAYYDVMNGCSGGKHFWSINPLSLGDNTMIVYELGVGAITPGGKA